jgi:hypothetical protein
MRLTDWVFAFTHGLRYESHKTEKEELKFLEPFFKEQMLISPCQIEAIQFSKPYRLLLLFFFDKTRPDLPIHISQEKWISQNSTAKKLISKYSALRINHYDIQEIMERCRNYPEKLIYGIDFIKNLCCICFTRDPRQKGSPFPWAFDYVTDPQKSAEMVFRLNLGQASMYFKE